MNRRMLSMVLSIVAAPVAGRLLGAFLAGPRGAKLLEALDRRQLTPFEHRVLAQQWSGTLAKAIVAAAITLFLAEQVSQAKGRPLVWRNAGEQAAINWSQVLHRAAEILLALGAILKVMASFLEEREEVAGEKGS